MKCPHCQHHLDHPVNILRRKRVKAGKCIDCGTRREGDDLVYIRCDACRAKARKQARLRRGWSAEDAERTYTPV